MHRMEMAPRQDWQEDMENELSFTYHSFPSGEEWKLDPYWQEKAFYVFTEKQVDELEKAGIECYELFCETIDELVTKKDLGKLGIDPRWQKAIEESWNRDDPSVIGRFDFSYDGINPPKLLEFNGDTPTSMFEASVVQWYVKEKRFGLNYDQFNFIHEQLENTFEELHDKYGITECDFASTAVNEDMTNALYAMKIAQKKKIECEFTAIDDVGYDRYNSVLFAESNRTIKALYKLYPFEHWIEDDPALLEAVLPNTKFIEPFYKMAMSTKAALAQIHSYAPDCPYFLKAFLDKEKADKELKGSFASKPFFEREGHGVKLVENGQVITESDYVDQNRGTVYQELAKLPSFQDTRDKEVYNPVIGIWVIGGEICGMGIRENKGLITDNNSLFVPHIFVKNEAEIAQLRKQNSFSMKM